MQIVFLMDLSLLTTLNQHVKFSVWLFSIPSYTNVQKERGKIKQLVSELVLRLCLRDSDPRTTGTSPKIPTCFETWKQLVGWTEAGSPASCDELNTSDSFQRTTSADQRFENKNRHFQFDSKEVFLLHCSFYRNKESHMFTDCGSSVLLCPRGKMEVWLQEWK